MFLVEFLKSILEFFQSMTDNFGLSIILLSLSVTVMMLPLFWIAEIIQNQERLRKIKMQPLLDDIKDVKNKQEKYYYTKEIYRKYHYSPFYGLTSMIGLLIQVPFFLAAYWMLLEYLPLQGIAFGPIKDLYKPDGLIAIGGLTINLLPFVMTFVNLLSGFLYTKNKDKSERIQLMGIALVFLILLYNLSSALVIYWTMNNVFAIGKNWLIANVKLIGLENFLTKHLSKLKNKGYIIYPLLLATFPLLSVYFANIGELNFSEIVGLLIAILLSTLLLLVLAKAIFKEDNKVTIFGILVLILFFSFGHLRDLFVSYNVLILTKYSILGGIYIALGCLFSLYLFKVKKNLNKVTRALNVLSICLFSLILIRILAYNINNYNNGTSQDTLTEFQDVKATNSNIGDEHYPDIYYIVLDGYANSRILKDKHEFDNGRFESSLEKRGFYIGKDSRANFMMTFLSLAATLNMDYVNHLSDDVGENSKDMSLPHQMISDNKVTKYLKNKGYKTVNFRSGWGATNEMAASDHNYPKKYALGAFSTTFLQTTVLLPVINRMASKNYADNILFAFNNINKIDNIVEPKFIFAHVVCPHPPYLFDENGQNISTDIKLNNVWDNKDYYLNQVKFVNKKTIEFIDGILEKSTDAIIILQSDHGPSFLRKDGDNPSAEFIQERGKILNAILMDKKATNSLYPEISSVNTFRVIFNNVFKDNFELLKDSTFYSSYERPYKFINVTDIIDAH